MSKVLRQSLSPSTSKKAIKQFLGKVPQLHHACAQSGVQPLKSLYYIVGSSEKGE
jgi:hypothetical protein